MNWMMQKSDRRFAMLLGRHSFYGNKKKEKVNKKFGVHSAVCGIRDGLPIEERIESWTNDRIDQ